MRGVVHASGAIRRIVTAPDIASLRGQKLAEDEALLMVVGDTGQEINDGLMRVAGDRLAWADPADVDVFAVGPDDISLPLCTLAPLPA